MPPSLSKRLQALPPYPFAGLERKINRLVATGKDVIRLDIGSPDLPPANSIIDAMIKSVRNKAHHGYAGYFGRPELRQAIADYYARRFNVTLNVDTEMLPLIGSKEGIYNLAFAYLDSDDVALVPSLAYPTYATGAQLAGAKVVSMRMRPDVDWTPDFEELSMHDVKRAKIMWLNYPNNPTGGLASIEFFTKAVEFARQHNILIAHDNPYAEIGFDGYLAPSILQVPGAKEVAVEFNSLSKSYNMGGWRSGMIVGNAEAVAALSTLKTQIDSGHFRAIQDAAVEALNGDQEWISERNDIYRERRDLMLAGLESIGCTVHVPRATIYLWARIPPEQTSSEDFCTWLLESSGVSFTPGTAFGAAGEGYLRVSLVQPTERMREALDRLREL